MLNGNVLGRPGGASDGEMILILRTNIYQYLPRATAISWFYMLLSFFLPSEYIF